MRRTALIIPTTVALLVAMTATAFGQAQDIPDLYSTGVDTMGTPIMLGATDANWEVREDAGPWLQAEYGKTNYCGSCGGVWIDWPIGDNTLSRSLAHPDYIETTAAGRKFSWRQDFTLPAGADLSTATIEYRVGYDDLSRNAQDSGNLNGCNHTVWLNGTPYSMTSSGNNQATECVGTIPAGSAFVAGTNTIEFRIQNISTYYGFRFEKVLATYELPCGDGVVQQGEECDDGNTTDGDGCSATCVVEDGYACTSGNLVENGDFEQGDTGFMSVLAVDPMPNPVGNLCANGNDDIPRDDFYLVTASPYITCRCDGGSGLCLAVNGGGGAIWSQTLSNLAPNTTYDLSLRYALKDESSAVNAPSLEVAVDGTQIASTTMRASNRPLSFNTLTAQFTTGAGQTSATLNIMNPNASLAGNDLVIDTITVLGPSVCEPLCGNGALDAAEACDDGNTNPDDGCSADCTIEDGFECTGEPSVCMTLAVCGDGLIEGDEACDDGNTTAGDGCDADCVVEDDYGCTGEPSECQPLICEIADLYPTGVDDTGAPVALGMTDTHWETRVDMDPWAQPLYDQNNYCGSCGGTWLDWPVGANMVSRPLTHPDFVRTPAPGRKFSWRQEFTVPAGADPSSVSVSYKVGFDDASRDAADMKNMSGCDHTVWLNGTPYAMTSTGNPMATECVGTIPAGSAFVAGTNTIEFRIQNISTYYGFRVEKVSSTCDLTCGDGVVDEGEECDDGNNAGGDGCDLDCTIEDGYSCAGEPSMCMPVVMCGDGVVSPDEQCDDGNTTNDDGCSEDCRIEQGYACNGEPSMCMVEAMCGDGVLDEGEACDDGNANPDDGCNECVISDGWICVGEPSSCDLDPNADDMDDDDTDDDNSDDDDDAGDDSGDGSGDDNAVDDGCAVTAPTTPVEVPWLVIGLGLMLVGLRRRVGRIG